MCDSHCSISSTSKDDIKISFHIKNIFFGAAPFGNFFPKKWGFPKLHFFPDISPLCVVILQICQNKKSEMIIFGQQILLLGVKILRENRKRKKVVLIYQELRRGWFFSLVKIFFYLGAIQIRRVGIGQNHSTNNHKAGT